MGRMESKWGHDCLEFNPGRWITDQGRIKTEPSFKFTAFNAGPRSCLGKEISFIQLKIVAASIISLFKFEVVENHRRSPSNSAVLLMKHGLKVKVSKIWSINGSKRKFVLLRSNCWCVVLHCWCVVLLLRTFELLMYCITTFVKQKLSGVCFD